MHGKTTNKNLKISYESSLTYSKIFFINLHLSISTRTIKRLAFNSCHYLKNKNFPQSNPPTVQCASTLHLIYPDIYPSVIFGTASPPPDTCFDFQFPHGPLLQQIPLNKIKMFHILIKNYTNTTLHEACGR
jgi:hypothetical protein